MKTKGNPILMFIFILIIGGITFLLVGGYLLGGYRVPVEGEVCRSITGEWSITINTGEGTEDNSLLEIEDKMTWYWPWESKSILVYFQASGPGYHEGEVWLDPVNAWLGGCQEYTFDFRHLPEGEYEGIVDVYEAEKTDWFGIPTGESGRKHLLTKEFTFEV